MSNTTTTTTTTTKSYKIPGTKYTLEIGRAELDHVYIKGNFILAIVSKMVNRSLEYMSLEKKNGDDMSSAGSIGGSGIRCRHITAAILEYITDQEYNSCIIESCCQFVDKYNNNNKPEEKERVSLTFMVYDTPFIADLMLSSFSGAKGGGGGGGLVTDDSVNHLYMTTVVFLQKFIDFILYRIVFHTCIKKEEIIIDRSISKDLRVTYNDIKELLKEELFTSHFKELVYNEDESLESPPPPVNSSIIQSLSKEQYEMLENIKESDLEYTKLSKEPLLTTTKNFKKMFSYYYKSYYNEYDGFATMPTLQNLKDLVRDIPIDIVQAMANHLNLDIQESLQNRSTIGKTRLQFDDGDYFGQRYTAKQRQGISIWFQELNESGDDDDDHPEDDVWYKTPMQAFKEIGKIKDFDESYRR
ncbi:hypothetical protein DFA_02300 [Cavenderia fasciculata]|uniref:Uncharacterized protein n=1 Tax=Cavenderia fasciculata TaxID=261658 RepID=F4PZ27_CACFS|nr:uncharacterized protein DFA_02300 [Cavenderia fasciculata]EGG19056.1 hypothetical protein DFA_02300 [Cavenderia fasciculata]|eukprot:XP_004366689.1 hypothetical protein DFA_02300 [Cavenderia fasciculata]